MTHRNENPRRALVLVGERGPRYEADVVLDGDWTHLTEVLERIYGDLYQPRGDRSLRKNNLEIRWLP